MLESASVLLFQFCVSDVGTLSTLIAPGAASGVAEPAAGTSERSCDADPAPTNKPGTAAAQGADADASRKTLGGIHHHGACASLRWSASVATAMIKE